MSAADTHAVLKDILFFASVVLAVGLAFYGLVRARTGLAWQTDGNVLARPYGAPDAAVALLILTGFAWITLQSGGPEMQKLDDATYAVGIFINAVMMLGMAGLLLWYMRVIRRLSPVEMFGLQLLKLPTAMGLAFAWVLAVALALGAAVYVIYHYAFGGNFLDETSQEVVETFKKTDSVMFKVLLGFAAVVVAPITEEIFFRGFLYGVVKRYSERWFAAAFTSLVFAVVHQHVGSLVPLFFLALGFSIAYEVTGCLLVPIFMHAFFNGFNVAVLAWS